MVNRYVTNYQMAEIASQHVWIYKDTLFKQLRIGSPEASAAACCSQVTPLGLLASETPEQN